MKIPYHINISKLVTLIKDQLNDFNGEAEIVLKDAEKDGYIGQFEINIGADNDNFDALDYKNLDITRFPARIKAAATSLKLLNVFGRFRISHKNGVLNIKKQFRNLNLYEVYSRQEIHSVFSPGAGTWGNQLVNILLTKE